MTSGLGQIDRYLRRCWRAAKLPAASYEDASQSVYLCLIEERGAAGFAGLVAAVEGGGIIRALEADSSGMAGFKRVVDRVKKRVQRERRWPAYEYDPPGRLGGVEGVDVSDAIASVLAPRAARLVVETIAGRTPSEIATAWGLHPKTVSNEKAKAYRKLRDVLSVA